MHPIPGAKKPAWCGQGWVSMGDVKREDLERVRDEMARRTRDAIKNAAAYENGSYGRRFIEHGAMCYFNCWASLQELLGDEDLHALKPPQEEKSQSLL